jgi:hypothetical protein
MFPTRVHCSAASSAVESGLATAEIHPMDAYASVQTFIHQIGDIDIG